MVKKCIFRTETQEKEKENKYLKNMITKNKINFEL